MGNQIKKWIQVTLTKRTHKANEDGVTATWCWSDITSIKGKVFGEVTDSDSKQSGSLSILKGGENIAKSSGLGIFIWMNKYDDTYAQTIIDTYGDSEKYAQLSPEEMIETMSLPSQSVFAS